jgi:hypothetical protein
MWKASGSTEDYHSQMNYENYEKLLLERLILNLQPTSLVLIDDAPYHNVLFEGTCSSKSRKVDMNWLSSHGISCSDMLKPQPHSLIQIQKPHSSGILCWPHSVLIHTQLLAFQSTFLPHRSQPYRDYMVAS